MTPKLGLALIAKNEEKRLPNLLTSVSGCFDYVAMVDTGSTDKTVKVFNDWVRKEMRDNHEFRGAWAPEPWDEDFASPRRRADGLLMEWPDCEVFCWADCDDTLTHPERLRALAASLIEQNAAAYVFDYAYAHDQHGNVTCRLKRERLVRRGAGTWQGRVHEAQFIDGPAAYQPSEMCEWTHHPSPEGRVADRNLRILRAWLKEEPKNPRVLGYVGTEYLARGKVKQATGYFRRYLKEQTGWEEERAQVHRKLATCLIAQGQLQQAQRTALDALALMPQWTDTYLTLAEVAYHQRDFQKAGDWAKRVLELGCPDTLLIVNPLEYAVQPRIIIAGSLGGLGRYEGAITVGQEVLDMVPDHAEVANTLQNWRVLKKREDTAQRAIESAQLLVAHDEQLKALTLLEECVPVFATDHPNVVAIRSQLRERLSFLNEEVDYAQHNERAPDNAPQNSDEQAIEIAERLPRSHFLLQTLRELEAA